MLVEREAELDELQGLAAEGFGGNGRLVFVGGEAGVGKSALARELAVRLASRCLVRWGTLDNLTTAEPLAVLLEAMPELAPVDLPDRLQLFRAVRELLRRRPTLLVLEDLHWADQATLDALRFLGRRLDGLPVLILASYRRDDVPARHRLSMVMGELAGLPDVRRMELLPLSTGGVAALVGAAGADVEADALHARTQGNPFFVTEVLAGGGSELPVTIRDAVLTRVARLSDAGAQVAAAAAILGMPASLDLLAAVSGCPLAAIDECLDSGVLIAAPDGVVFRHELAREAVEDSLSSVQRRRLHQRALRDLTASDPTDHRTLAHHAAAAGEAQVAFGHAVAAGARAAGLGAHREAAAQYRVALRVLPSDERGAAQRAELFEALSYECYLTDQLPEAVAMRQRAHELHELAGDTVRVGDCLRWLSRLSWFLARNDDAERYGVRAVQVLQGPIEGHELAMAYSNLSQLRMLAGDAVGAERWGDLALAVAERNGDVEVQIHALNNVGAAVSCAGRADDGGRMLRRSLSLALAQDAHEHVARAYTNLGSCAAMNRRFTDSLEATRLGIAYCQERDLDSWVRYMQAWQVLALAETARWPEAVSVAEALLQHPELSPVSAIPAAAALARIEARGGLDVTQRLATVTALATSSGELQRIAPVCCALAEAAWLAGRVDDLSGLVEPAWSLAARHEDAWVDGELRWWRRLGGIVDEVPDGVPAPFALMLRRRFEEAARAWDALGCAVWAAYCRGLADEVPTAQRGLSDLAALGASASVEALLRTRRDWGLELPRRPRAAARERFGQLTGREVEVLRLLAEGLSTAEIADRLVVSPRTVEHHVSAVLQKLGEPTRARAVASARRQGLVTSG